MIYGHVEVTKIIIQDGFIMWGKTPTYCARCGINLKPEEEEERIIIGSVPNSPLRDLIDFFKGFGHGKTKNP